MFRFPFVRFVGPPINSNKRESKHLVTVNLFSPNPCLYASMRKAFSDTSVTQPRAKADRELLIASCSLRSRLISRRFLRLRRYRFYLNRLGWDADRNRVRINVLGRYTQRSQQAMLMHAN